MTSGTFYKPFSCSIMKKVMLISVLVLTSIVSVAFAAQPNAQGQKSSKNIQCKKHSGRHVLIYEPVTHVFPVQLVLPIAGRIKDEEFVK